MKREHWQVSENVVPFWAVERGSNGMPLPQALKTQMQSVDLNLLVRYSITRIFHPLVFILNAFTGRDLLG